MSHLPGRLVDIYVYMFICLYIYIFICLYVYKIVYISILVMGDASDIMEYGRRRSELSNAPFYMKQDVDSIEQ